MANDKEIRVLQIEVSELTRPPVTRELRAVKVRVLFSDSTWSDLTTHTSMNPWPSDDLLDTVKKFVAGLERN